MGKKSKKLRQSARSRSEDQVNSMYKLGQTLSDPLAEYRNFLDTLRVYGTSSKEVLYIPVNLIDLTATLITSLISGHDVTAHLVSFTVPAPAQPNTSSEFNFIRRIIARTKLSCTTFLLGLFFVSRLQVMSKRIKGRTTRRTDDAPASSPSESPTRSQQATVETRGTIPTFLASVICADKFLYDATYTNADWAVFTDGRYSTQDINTIETEFLRRIDFKLFFFEKEYLAFLDNMDLMICLRQIYRWSTLSYTDLYRLSSTIQPVFQWQLTPKVKTTDALVLLVRFLANYVVSYLVALATAIAAASLVRAAVVQGAVIVSGGNSSVGMMVDISMPLIRHISMPHYSDSSRYMMMQSQSEFFMFDSNVNYNYG